MSNEIIEKVVNGQVNWEVMRGDPLSRLKKTAKRIEDPIKAIVDHVGRNVTPSYIFLFIPDKTPKETLSLQDHQGGSFCEVNEDKWRSK